MTRRERAIVAKTMFAAQRADEAVRRLAEAVGELAKVPGYVSVDFKSIHKLTVEIGQIYARLRRLSHVGFT
jgi:hypothetical protein